MSQFVTIETIFMDGKVLFNALRKLYPKVEQGQSIRLYNYVNKFNGRVADIVVRKQYIGDGHLSNDVGFRYDKTSGTYRLVIGDFDMDRQRFDIEELEHLYTKEKMLKELRNEGYKIISHQQMDKKTVTLQVERLKEVSWR